VPPGAARTPRTTLSTPLDLTETESVPICM